MINWAEFMQLEWSHPWWLILALQPVLMGLLLNLRRSQILHYADAPLRPWVVRDSEDAAQRRVSGLLNLAAWSLLALAAAGPRLPLLDNNAQQAIARHEMDVMVLLDVSPSMQAQDVSPQRLQRARLELMDLLPMLHGERLGLIAFSGSAGLIMPLSRDYSAVPYYLNIAGSALFDTPGTALASALELALRKLKEQKSASRAILLLSDAETSALSGTAGAAVWEVADKLKLAGVRLYILGIGTAAGASIPQANGFPLVSEGVEVISTLDQSGFSDLAKKTNGKFTLVEDGAGDWRSLYERGLLTLPGGKQQVENVQAWREMYAIFLLPALILFAWRAARFKLKRVLPKKMLPIKMLTVAAILLLVATTAQEIYASEGEAYSAWQNKNHTLAQNLYHEVPTYSGRMGEGAAAYRRRDYSYAIRQFSAALLEARNAKQREQALYNLGNSYFMAAAYRAAGDAFLGVLRYAPENNDARANLALTAGVLAGIRKSGKNTQGILGRRGREVGGGMGEDTSDKPLAMDEADEKQDKLLRAGSDLTESEKAKLRGFAALVSGDKGAALDQDIAYRAALKKLELATDKPVPIHQSLIKIEAARNYEPLPEMPPW